MQPRLEPAPPWRVPSSSSASRDAVAQRINAHADRLGTGRIDAMQRVIATGHQAWLWHPGILAKDIAMVAACEASGGSPVHMVVDQDAHEALSLTLPVVEGERLTTHSVRLASHDPSVPTGWQPAVDVSAVRECLSSLPLWERVGGEGSFDQRASSRCTCDRPSRPHIPSPQPSPRGRGSQATGRDERRPS